MHLEERSGLGGDMDSGVRRTIGGHRSDAPLTRVHLEDTTARAAPGGYGGQADLTGTEDMAGSVSTVSLNRDDIAAAEEHCEHRLLKPGRDGWSGGYGVDAAVEYREHRLVKPGRGFQLGGRRIVSTVSLNRAEDMSVEELT
jgi:hypothetical protein